MADAVVAIDMGDEPLKEADNLNKWFEDRGYEVNDDNIVNDHGVISFSHYPKAGVVIYRFDNSNEYFPPIVMEFISKLDDGDNTTVSVAEEGEYGFDTIVEMNLADFIKHIINEEDPTSEEE